MGRKTGNSCVLGIFVVLIGFVFTACPVEPEPEPGPNWTIDIIGNTMVGQTLYCRFPSYFNSDFLSDLFYYEWKRGDTEYAVNAAIPGANKSTYTLTQADVGKYIAVTGTLPYETIVYTNNTYIGTYTYYPGKVTSAAFGPATATATDPLIIVLGDGLDAKLAWLKTNAQNNTSYLVRVDKNENLTGITGDNDNSNNLLSYYGKNNITIWLEGNGGERIVSLASNGELFTVGDGVMLVLDKNITLKGRTDNGRSLVKVVGALEMKDGAKITDNTSSSSFYGGGGVFVCNGTFTKSGGTITGYASDTVNGNVVKYNGVVQTNCGHAVYVLDYDQRRGSTAGPGVNLDSSKTGAAGGWEN